MFLGDFALFAIMWLILSYCWLLMTEIMSTNDTTKVIVRLLVARIAIGCLPMLISGIDSFARMKDAIHKR